VLSRALTGEERYCGIPAWGRSGGRRSPLMRIFIVSQISLYREGLSALLDRRDGMEVIGVAADESEAVDMLLGARLAPDIILLDMSRPDGVTAARWLIDEVPDVRVFAITVPNHEREVVACAEVGVAGFVTSEASLDDLVDALQCAARGEMLCSPAIAAALLRRIAAVARDRELAKPLTLLTSREREIVALIDEGLSNKQIAQRLFIELPTVRNHVHNILGKLGVHRRAEAVALIRRQRSIQAPGTSVGIKD
jgi:two-component system nitrate/nitrite response regulator NarL